MYVLSGTWKFDTIATNITGLGGCPNGTWKFDAVATNIMGLGGCPNRT